MQNKMRSSEISSQASVRGEERERGSLEPEATPTQQDSAVGQAGMANEAEQRDQVWMRDREERGRGDVPSPDDVARRAYDIYCQHGCEDGHDTEHWLQAERELRQKS